MRQTLESDQALAGPTKHLLQQLAVTLGFVVFAQLGGLFELPDGNVALVWPAAGLALAVTYRLGPRYLLGVAVGAVSAYLLKGSAVAPAAALSGGTVAGAYLGAWLLRRGKVDSAGSRLPDVLWMLAALSLAAAASSLVGAAATHLAGLPERPGFARLWWICWVADAVGGLLVLPLLLSWWNPTRRLRQLSRRVESWLALVATVATTWVIYADVLPAGLAMARPLSYLVFPLFIWAAVRLGMRPVSLLLFVHAATAVSYTAAGGGPFATGSLTESVLALHSHLAMLSISILLLTAAMSERNANEAALREREARYRLLVENQTDFLLKTDPDGLILFVSPSFCDLLGASEQDLIGRPCADLLTADRDTADQAWRALMAPPYACYLEQPLTTATGQRWIGWAAKSVVEDGAVQAVVAVGRDITDRRAAEDKARQHLQELAHVSRIGAMGELAAGLAHELNQPLCAITSFSQACQRLLGADADPEVRNAMARVAANATRAGDIIRQMRAFVRKDGPSLEIVDINALVEETAGLTRTDVRHHGAQLELDITPGLPAVNVAPIQVQQVLVNLIRNALEAMAGTDPAARRVRICTRLNRDGLIEVSVADTGPGLPAGLMDQVFEPFATTKAGGMGLGLSISRSIIESHGGGLTARTASSGGAEFRFTLNAAEYRRTGSA